MIQVITPPNEDCGHGSRPTSDDKTLPDDTGRGRDKLRKYYAVVKVLIGLTALFPRGFRLWLFNRLNGMGGMVGIGLRFVLLKTLARFCGFNVSLQRNVYISNLENISFGDNVSIHSMCYIDGSAPLTIGNDVSIAHGTTIMTSTHNYASQDLPIKDQGMQYKAVEIGDNVWIGAKCTLLAGVKVAAGCADARLLLAGTGELLEPMRREAARLGIAGSVTFLGVRSDCNRIMQAADAFVMPSLFEGLPVVLVEAQAAGLPVFCSDTISEMSKIADDYHTLPLTSTAAQWADTILGGIGASERRDTSAAVRAAGFDIRETARELIKTYSNEREI